MMDDLSKMLPKGWVGPDGEIHYYEDVPLPFPEDDDDT